MSFYVVNHLVKQYNVFCLTNINLIVSTERRTIQLIYKINTVYDMSINRIAFVEFPILYLDKVFQKTNNIQCIYNM